MDDFFKSLDKIISLALRRIVCGFVFIFVAFQGFPSKGEMERLLHFKSGTNILLILCLVALVVGSLLYAIHKTGGDYLIHWVKCKIFEDYGYGDWEIFEWRWCMCENETPALCKPLSDWADNLYVLYTSSLAIFCGLPFVADAGIGYKVIVCCVASVTWLCGLLSDIRKTEIECKAMSAQNDMGNSEGDGRKNVKRVWAWVFVFFFVGMILGIIVGHGGCQ